METGNGPNKPNTINLWESGLKNWANSDFYNSYWGLGTWPRRVWVLSCDAFNAVVAAFSQDISASLSFLYALVIYLYLWNFLESGLRESRGSSHQQTSCPRRVFLSDQPPWMLTRSTVSYNGPLWFLLLGRIVGEMLLLGPDHGPIFYSPQY